MLAPFTRRSTFTFLLEATTLVATAQQQYVLAWSGTFRSQSLDLTRGPLFVSPWRPDVASC